ncbi:MAG TPA: hypothetical protein PKV33_08655 [Methanothrix sp.]|nr:hypothetical protein [Methanothrix sp.]
MNEIHTLAIYQDRFRCGISCPFGFILVVNYRVLEGAASHFIAKTCITDM